MGYRSVEFAPGYHITDTGEVLSSRKYKHPTPLKQHLNRCGYLTVSISVEGVRKFRTIHRILGLAFIPNPDSKPQINHIDGNKTNNDLTNLEWCTNSENQLHAWSTGLREFTPAQAESNKQYRKLTYADAEYIRAVHIPRHKEFGIRALARKFNVSKQPIQKILSNLNYKEV